MGRAIVSFRARGHLLQRKRHARRRALPHQHSAIYLEHMSPRDIEFHPGGLFHRAVAVCSGLSTDKMPAFLNYPLKGGALSGQYLFRFQVSFPCQPDALYFVLRQLDPNIALDKHARFTLLIYPNWNFNQEIEKTATKLLPCFWGGVLEYYLAR